MASIRKYTTAKGSKRWSVRWRDPDGRQREKRNVPSREAAKQLQRDVEAAVCRGFRWEQRDARAIPTLWDLAEVLLSEAVVLQLKPNSIKRKTQSLGLWLRWLEDDLGRVPTCGDLDRAMLMRFASSLRDPKTGRHLHGRKESTVHKHVTEVELTWRWLWDRADEEGYPCPRPRSIGLRRPPSPEKLAPTWAHMDLSCAAAAALFMRRSTRLLCGLDVHPLFRVAVIMRYTGLRVQQVMGLDWSDVDLERATLRIRPELGKSRQESRGRVVPISAHLVREFAEWGTGDGWIVPTWQGGNNPRVVRSRDMRKAWLASGVPEDRWRGCPDHAYRAGLQSGLKRLGADDEAVKQLVGHSRGTRGRYVDSESLPMRHAVSLIPTRVMVADAGGVRSDMDKASRVAESSSFRMSQH